MKYCSGDGCLNASVMQVFVGHEVEDESHSEPHNSGTPCVYKTDGVLDKLCVLLIKANQL